MAQGRSKTEQKPTKPRVKRQSPASQDAQERGPTAAPKGKDLASNSFISYQEEMSLLETDRARNIDDLALHDDLMGGILGSIKKDLQLGLPSDKILEKYAALAAARTVTIAATDADSGKALAASKDILDRVQGRAVERKQIQHKLENVDPSQLDALLLSELEAIEIDSSEVE